MMEAPLLIKMIQWLWVPLTGIVGWVIKRLEKRLEELHLAALRAEGKADALKFDVARHYVTRREHLDAANRIDGKLDRILDRLDKKADK